MDLIWEKIQFKGGLTPSEWDEHIDMLNQDMLYYLNIAGNAFSRNMNEAAPIIQFLSSWFERLPDRATQEYFIQMIVEKELSFQEHGIHAATLLCQKIQWFPEELCKKICLILNFYDKFCEVMIPLGEDAIHFFPRKMDQSWIWMELPPQSNDYYQTLWHPTIWSLITPTPSEEDIQKRTEFLLIGSSKQTSSLDISEENLVF